MWEQRPRPNRRLDELTRSEVYALRWFSHGLNRAMVADMMGVSPETVKSLTERARLKLAAKTTAQAVAIALRHGLID